MDMNTETNYIAISKDIEYIRKDLAEIKQTIKDQSVAYVTQIQFTDLQKEIVDLKKSNFHKYGIPFISSVLTAVFVFLILFFLNNVK